jgi:hypothetical protein
MLVFPSGRRRKEDFRAKTARMTRIRGHDRRKRLLTDKNFYAAFLTFFDFLVLAHRAFCAAEILSLASLDSFRFVGFRLAL